MVSVASGFPRSSGPLLFLGLSFFFSFGIVRGFFSLLAGILLVWVLCSVRPGVAKGFFCFGLAAHRGPMGGWICAFFRCYPFGVNGLVSYAGARRLFNLFVA